MTDNTTMKLAALDPQDLEVISAHLQDAVMRVGDIRWLKRERKLALVANRFDHLAAAGSSDRGERRLTGLQLSRVERVAASNIRMDDKTAILSLLAITFEPGATAPEGSVVLTFAGGGTIRAAVECIEAAMADLGPKWAARARPEHDAGGSAGDGKA
ncbi:MAG: DUF2948 family protein [Anderseniella sp.]|jgi:hypothetical protein|nr:DUF2948 family protein [Anderseniella sp.]